MTNSRRTNLEIVYNSQNVTSELKEYIKTWTYTDNLSGQIDDVQVVLEDIENLWLSSWFPSKGSTLNLSIVRQWWSDTLVRTKIGKFEVDEIEASGEPTEVIIKALSVPESTSIRGENKSKSWEKTTLKVVAGDIAKNNKLKLYYQANENPKKDRYEQDGETDLMFLYRLCREEGFCLKLSNNSIIILDEADYEQKAAVTTINRKSNPDDLVEVLGWSARTTLSGTYKACKVQHYDSKKKKTIQYTFTPTKGPKTGRTLIVKEEVKSVAEAQRMAKKKLREANKEATKVFLTVATEKHFDAGMTVNLSKFGKFDGKYIIVQAAQSDSSVTLQLRKCLEGY